MKIYDLEERTTLFAKAVKACIKELPKTWSDMDYFKQVLRSSSSVAANYIEANESLGKKDFFMRIKICKKEAKETILWLNLIEFPISMENRQQLLLREATEIMKILGAILNKRAI